MRFLILLADLVKAKVQFLIAGGIAVNLHGFVRATYDLDLTLCLTAENLDRASRVLSAHGYRPQLPISQHDLLDEDKRQVLIKDRHMAAYCFVHESDPLATVDVLIDLPVSFESLVQHQKMMDLSGCAVPVVSVDDLIILKTYSNRERDRIDIRALQEIKRYENREAR